MPFIKGEHHTKETRKKMRLSHKGKRHTEKTKNKMSKSQSGEKNSFYGKHHTNESKRKKRLANMGQKRTKETRDKLSLSKMGHIVTEETRKKIRTKALKQFENGMPEETRNKISSAHIDWDFYNEHGCTRDQYPYGPEWTQKLKKQIAERDNCTCQLCGEVLPDKWGTHHIDYDKWNNSEYNLVFLCNYCHSKTNHNRTFWEQHFKQLQIARGFGVDQYNGDQTIIDNWT